MVSTGRNKNDLLGGISDPIIRTVLLGLAPILMGILLYRGAFGPVANRANVPLTIATAYLLAVRIYTLVLVFFGHEYLGDENMAEVSSEGLEGE